ncbi:MAG TPA: hypothetical protein VEZ40_03170 [Pyrinomonadaceae bacterium]|nr:hypothetical protein [Pyrinomonadaceae bacterium]
MRLSKTLVALLLCAATFPLTPVAAAARPSQKARAKTQAPATHTEITKEKIETIVSTLEQAGKKKDVAVIIPYLAPDMTYKLEGGGRPPRHANRAHYIELTKIGFALMLDHVYMRKSLTIKVAPDGQSATAQTAGYEMLTLAQGTVAGHTTSLVIFKIYKGKILIASMESAIEYV